MDTRYTSINGAGGFRLQSWKKLLIISVFVIIGLLLFDSPLARDIKYGIYIYIYIFFFFY